jgi:hypothetical protein
MIRQESAGVAGWSDANYDAVIQQVNRGQEELELDPLTAPRTRRPPRRFDGGSQPAELTVTEFYRQQYYQLLDKVNSSLCDRFLPNNDLRMYCRLEDFLLGKANMSDVDEADYKAFADDVNFSALNVELGMMSMCKANGTIPQFDSLSAMAAALLDKPPEVRALFTETVNVANLLLVVPATSATAERSFSNLRRVKTWQNSTVTQARLNSVALLHCYREMQPNLDQIISDFVGLNDYRRKFFGNC